MSYPSVFSTPGVAGFADKVDLERARQLRKWGDQHHPDGTGDDYWRIQADAARARCDALAALGKLTWRDILAEEVFEAFAESEPEELKTELIQCAAVIQAWIYDVDAREETA